MIFTREGGLIIDALGGAAVAALGIWVLTLRPRVPAAVALGVFCATFGVATLVQNAIDVDAPTPIAYTFLFGVEVPLLFAAGASILALAHIFPGASRARFGKRFTVVVAAAALFVLAWSFSPHDLFLPYGLAQAAGDEVIAEGATFGGSGGGIGARFVDAAWAFFFVALVAAVFALAWRWQFTDDAQERRRLALVSGPLLVFPGFAAGALYVVDPGRWLWLALLVAVALVGVLWLANTRRGPATRAARNVGLVAFGVLLAGAVTVAAGAVSGAAGVARLVMTFLLANAILRQQLFGLEAKLRFAISKSTIAAVFIAVFFIASEVAQQFFSERTSSTYIGIGIAGTLVFAMAPLQRVAEKLAAKAVPGAPSTSVQVGMASENAYRRAVRLALRDRDLSTKEERELVLLAHDLGLTPAQAFAIRDDVVREAA